MLAFNHILAGSIVAAITPTPLVPLVPVFAFVSHFILDLFPHAHGEEPPYSKFLKAQIIFDTMISLVAIGYIVWLFPDRWFMIGVGAFFGLLPDFFWVLWRKGGPEWFQAFLDWAHWIQWGERPYGWMFDLFYGGVMTVILFNIAH